MKNDEHSISNLYWMLLQVAFRAKQNLIKTAEKHELTVVQLYTLGVMCPGKAVPMHILSGLLLCDASNVTGIVDRLLKGGYIVRQESPDDRRVKMISLTPAGEALRAEWIQTLSLHEPIELQRLTPEERSQLATILLRLTHVTSLHEE